MVFAEMGADSIVISSTVWISQTSNGLKAWIEEQSLEITRRFWKLLVETISMIKREDERKENVEEFSIIKSRQEES
jgi:hypothetical protein